MILANYFCGHGGYPNAEQLLAQAIIEEVGMHYFKEAFYTPGGEDFINMR
ncbi:hypothetical protein LZ480_17585 [Solibacillus sp. MA9]|uniref:Uncharacterized protein n=1 Tax=Solibacillus palustris TaxID=2908203 RepID=A0ABS9UH61_9BACL|nr:hypothetical protein [Solibacillus sp. MA9]MCH7323686.1 hypothetical protein [Solibacillus sp. MA9]